MIAVSLIPRVFLVGLARRFFTSQIKRSSVDILAEINGCALTFHFRDDICKATKILESFVDVCSNLCARHERRIDEFYKILSIRRNLIDALLDTPDNPKFPIDKINDNVQTPLNKTAYTRGKLKTNLRILVESAVREFLASARARSNRKHRERFSR